MTHIFLSLKKGIIVASGFGYAFKGGQGVLLATSLQVASRHWDQLQSENMRLFQPIIK